MIFLFSFKESLAFFITLASLNDFPLYLLDILKFYNVRYLIAKKIVPIEANVEINKAFIIFSGFTL